MTTNTKTITRLQIQKKNKERVSVYLDDEFAFGVKLDVALALRKGQQLSEAEITVLRDEDMRNKAFDRALHFLGFRPRSSQEIERYLEGKEYPDDVITEVMERLARYNYIDDEAFARFWLENRERFRPRGARALRYELRQKGVANGVIDAVLETLDEDDSAWAALQPKLERWRTLEKFDFRKKATGFLGRRGFGYEAIREAVDRGWAEIEAGE